MNASITVNLALMDAMTQIAVHEYSDAGEVIGTRSNEELMRDYADAEGKSVVRALCQCNGKQIGFVSRWLDWNNEKEREEAIRSIFQMVGESVATKQPWL